MNHSNTYRLIFVQAVFLLTCCFVACVDAIDFRPNSDVISSLTVSGKLVLSNPSIVTVNAGRVIDYDPKPTEGVNLKEVLLFDESGNEVSLPSVGIGKYALEIPKDFPDIKIEYGKSYGIRLEMRDGTIYESALEPLLPNPKPIALTYESSTRHVFESSGAEFDVPYLNFYLKTNVLDPSTGAPAISQLLIEQTTQFQDTSRQICYRTQQVNDNTIRLINGFDFTTDQVELLVYETNIHSGFSGESYVHVIQESLPTNAYTYFTSIQKVIARTGNMFEDPAGKVRSNIRNINDSEEDVFGFFYATTTDTIRVFVDPSTLPPDLRPYCQGSGQNADSFISYCRDCTTDPASTQIKPYYWKP